MRAPGPLPLLLLLLAGVPAARPAPPTCYSRLRALSREVTQDFQLLQVSEPSQCVSLSTGAVREVPAQAVSGHTRKRALPGGGRSGAEGSGLDLCCWLCGTESGRDLMQLSLCRSGYWLLPQAPSTLSHSQNYCVLDKLRDFVASPQCSKVAQVDSLKEKARKLYTIMNSFCRRDLVFLSDDCNALEYPIPVTAVLPDPQR
ncbi:Cytokine-like protein 1 [Plecturocebus cupreus]